MLFDKEDVKYKELDSKEVAKERLKNILMRDRVDISKDSVDMVRREIISVVKDYFVIKNKGSEVYLTNMRRGKSDEDENVLVALIPVVKSIKKEDLNEFSEDMENMELV